MPFVDPAAPRANGYAHLLQQELAPIPVIRSREAPDRMATDFHDRAIARFSEETLAELCAEAHDAANNKYGLAALQGAGVGIQVWDVALFRIRHASSQDFSRVPLRQLLDLQDLNSAAAKVNRKIAKTHCVVGKVLMGYAKSFDKSQRVVPGVARAIELSVLELMEPLEDENVHREECTASEAYDVFLELEGNERAERIAKNSAAEKESDCLKAVASAVAIFAAPRMLPAAIPQVATRVGQAIMAWKTAHFAIRAWLPAPEVPYDRPLPPFRGLPPSSSELNG